MSMFFFDKAQKLASSVLRVLLNNKLNMRKYFYKAAAILLASGIMYTPSLAINKTLSHPGFALTLHGITKALMLKMNYNGAVIINSNNKNKFADFKSRPSGLWQEYSF